MRHMCVFEKWRITQAKKWGKKRVKMEEGVGPWEAVWGKAWSDV